jgi:transcription termination factor NusB
MICLAEMLIVRPEDVPYRVSVDEAIELAKRYSDDAGKKLINGILNTIIAKREDIIKTWDKREALTYSFFQA